MIYTWEEFDDDCLTIFNWIQLKKLTFKNVYGLPRGGLPLAVKLSHLLEIPLTLDRITENTLVVDDISDTGNTLFSIKKTFPDITIITLFYHEDTKVVPSFTLREKTDKWIIYPWEV